MELPVLAAVQHKLTYFYQSKKIPHIIFHGPSGSGKRTIVERFLTQIYDGDKAIMKSNIMWVNCAHGNGRGIKFIREDLKFFAKSNIQFKSGVVFKTIVLLNADSLTTDAQSALRRCIELFSFNTRFFIIVENKHKLLNPILSRFCDIYVPEMMGPDGSILNLHDYNIKKAYRLEIFKTERYKILNERMDSIELSHKYLVEFVSWLYQHGYSSLDLMEWFREKGGDLASSVVMCFHKIKSEYRCEKLLMMYILDYAFLRENKDITAVGFI
jgi:DNA polymerase III delta prime subunit